MTKLNSPHYNPNLIKSMKEKLEGHLSGQDLSGLKKEKKNSAYFCRLDVRKGTVLKHIQLMMHTAQTLN